MVSRSTARSRRAVDNSAYLSMIRRMIRSAGRRCGDGMPEDLAALLKLKVTIDMAAEEAVAGLRGAGHTWQDIGDALGTTRQAAIMRWAMSS